MRSWLLPMVCLGMLSVFYGCQKPIAPDFKSIENVNVSLNGFTSADLNCDARFYNPNGKSIVLKNVKIDVNVDGRYLTSIDREYDMKLMPKEDFVVPVEANILFKNVDLKDVMALMKNTVGTKAFEFKGNIKVKMYGLNFNIPIDHMEHIKIR